MTSIAPFIQSEELNNRGPYQRERRRQLEKAGLHPPRIALTPRKNVWVRSEVEAWEKARAAGVTEAQVRELVRQMVAARVDGMPK